MVQSSKVCTSACPSFKCGKNSAFRRRDAVWCKETEEPCTIKTCTYSMCMKRRLLPQGVCGETVKRQTTEKSLDFEENFAAESVRLKGKALRKLGDDYF